MDNARTADGKYRGIGKKNRVVAIYLGNKITVA
jgi:hypothetical protein